MLSFGRSRTVALLALIPACLLALRTPIYAETYSATYQGGYPGLERNATGTIEINDEELYFYPGRRPPREGSRSAERSFKLPLTSIRGVSINEEAKRRVGAAALTTVLLGPLGLLFLFSKAEYDMVLVEYVNRETNQGGAVLFQTARGVGNSIKAMLEARCHLGEAATAPATGATAAPSSGAASTQNVFLDRGNELLRAGNAAGALEEFRKGYLVDSRNTGILLGMAKAHELNGNREAALENIRKVLEIDPANEEANRLLGAMTATSQ